MHSPARSASKGVVAEIDRPCLRYGLVEDFSHAMRSESRLSDYNYNCRSIGRTKGIMIDWQTSATVIAVLAATAWLLWTLVPRRNAPATGCGSGCSSCPAAATKSETPGGFVGLDVLQATIPTDAKQSHPVPTARS